MKEQWVLLFSAILFSLNIASATVFLTIYGNNTVQPGQNITLVGTLANDTSTSSPRPQINVTTAGNFSSSLSASTSTSNSSFVQNITAPSTTGEYNLTASTNSSDIHSRVLHVYVTNATTANISYIGSLPPFTNGTAFVFKLTLLNGTNVLVNNTPNVSIFISNGASVNWAITALNSTTDSNGAIYYSVSVPSNAATGTYALIVERGAFVSVFQISSGYVVAVNALTTAEEVSSNFGQSATVNILAKVRDANSNPVTVNGAYALVTLPNATTRNVTMYSHPTSSGYYNNTFNETSATGSYSVKVVARVGNIEMEANSLFNVKTFTARMEPQQDFFFEWGGLSSFKPGQRVGLNIIVTDLTNDSVVPAAPSSSLNCSNNIQMLGFIYVSNSTSLNNSAEVNASRTTAIDSSGQFMLSNVCRFTLQSAPQTSGLYNVRLNITYGGVTQTLDGFFAVSRYFMKASPVSSLGGSEDFMSMVTPGENTTLTVTARNTTNDQPVAGNLITNIVVNKLIPLEFKTGSSENTTVTYRVTNGTASTDPQITLHVPAEAIGPILVEIQASIGGEFVRGDAFFVANHLMGFMSPGGMGAGEEFEGGFFSACSGDITFSGMVMETKTLTAAQGVGITGIIQARDELTGRDVSSFLSVKEANASGSDGFLKAKIEFSSGGYSFSGFYFMVFNASYKGKYAGIPAGFMCKKLNFFPQIQAVGSTSFGWRVAPNSNITVTIQNIKRLNDSFVIGNQSNVTITQIMNFNPGKGGMKVLLPRNPSLMVLNVTKLGGTNVVSFNISPSDFMSSGQNLTQWPNGFMDLQPRVCTQSLDPAGGACDAGFGGFEVTPFDAWTATWDFGQVTIGEIKTYTIEARANISRTSQNDALNSFYTGTNQTGFQVKIGKPWEGEQNTLSTNATLLSNGWNSTNDTFGTERWNISFQVPTNVKKGDTMVMITVNNSDGQSLDLMMFFQVGKYSIVVPSEEGVGDPNSGGFNGYFVAVHSSLMDYGMQNATTFGWNWTAAVQNTGVNSTSGRVCFKNNFTATRYGSMSNQPVTAKDGMRVAVVDRYASSTYDTILLLNTSNNVTIVLNSTRRNVTAPTGQGDWYLWDIKDCGFFSGVNTTRDALPQGGNTWGGTYQVSKQFALPYVVKLGNTPQANVNVSVNGMGKQDNRGFGFESRLDGVGGGDPTATQINTPASMNYSFILGVTDANGVAFPKINSTATGRLVSFWKIDTPSGDTDTATMNSGTFLEVKAFRTSGDPIFILSKGLATLTWANNSQQVWGAFSNTTASGDFEVGVYNGTIVESSALDFARDGTADTWYIVYGPGTNKTKIGTTLPVSSSGSINSTSDTITASGNSLKVDSLQGNVNANDTILMHFLQSSPTAQSPTAQRPSFVTSSNQNITVKVCAETFTKPNPLPIENATVQLYVTDWFAFPPSQKNLDMFELANHTNVTSSLARTGPSGCVAINVGPGGLGSWPQGKPLFIEGTMTSGSNQEAVWVTDVYRSTV